MGLGPIEAEFLLAEHRYRPITGTFLTIGRQTVGLTPDEAVRLLAETGTPRRAGTTITLDTQTQVPHAAGGRISDDSFYALFMDAKLSIVDVSDYEGADILHDMNRPIGPELENRFDFIYCGSSMDNIFDPVTALRNMARMVKPGGRLFLLEVCSAFPTAYIRLMPDWFLDYFSANHFADCKAYLGVYPNLDRMRRPTGGRPYADLYYYDPVQEHSGQYGVQCSHADLHGFAHNFVLAEKAADSTWDASPIQVHYRMTEEVRRPYLDAALRFRAHPRPLFARPGKPVLGDPNLSRFGTLKPVASWEEIP